jgi:acyl-CoA synthetase (NDP forming)
MDSQLQQLRDAVKAVAKARAEGRPIDLSSLPPEIRGKIEAQLAKLPPDARQQLQQGAARGMAKVEHAANQVAHRVGSHSGHHSVAAKTYHGHYNDTVQPGDAARLPWMWIGGVLIVGAVLFSFL